MESKHVTGGTCGIKIASSYPPSKSHRLPSSVDPSVQYTAAANAVSDGKRASKYTALTPQVVHRHDIHQKRLHNQGHLHAAQQQHVDTLRSAAETLDIHLPYGHDTSNEDQVGMTPMERFKAACHYPYHQYNRYSTEAEPLNCKSNFQSDSHYISPKPSSIRVEVPYESSTQASPMYAEESSQPDTVYYIQEQSNELRTSGHDKDVAGWENDLAGIGAQFGSYPTLYCTQSLYCNDDVIEE